MGCVPQVCACPISPQLRFFPAALRIQNPGDCHCRDIPGLHEPGPVSDGRQAGRRVGRPPSQHPQCRRPQRPPAPLVRPRPVDDEALSLHASLGEVVQAHGGEAQYPHRAGLESARHRDGCLSGLGRKGIASSAASQPSVPVGGLGSPARLCSPVAWAQTIGARDPDQLTFDLR